MKVLGISGSPRHGGNTTLMVKKALKTLESHGIETEFISLAKHPIAPCIACMACQSAETPQCKIKSDDFHKIFEKIIDADGLLIGSPVYFGSATPDIMALLDRVGFVARKGDLLRRKVGASLVVARRAGQNFTFAQLNYFFLIANMIVPGSSYWNVAFGLQKGDIEQDAEGMRTVENLAENIAWLLKKIND